MASSSGAQQKQAEPKPSLTTDQPGSTTPVTCGSRTPGSVGTPGTPRTPHTPGSLSVDSLLDLSLLSAAAASSSYGRGEKSYDYLLKVLLVGDSDVGKQEILQGYQEGKKEASFSTEGDGPAYKETVILIDGKRVKLELWDTSGQGRFCTILRSYSRGAQGIFLVYDITNRWSFEGIQRWLNEVEQHAPGVPKVLVGNRLHLAFKRQVDQEEAEVYAAKNNMAFFEVSPLVNFNIAESFAELARMALRRNGMERLWRSNKVTSLYELCAHAIVKRTTVYGINRLPLPTSVQQSLKSYAMTSPTAASSLLRPGSHYKSIKCKQRGGKGRALLLPSSPGVPSDASNVRCGPVSRKSCVIS